MKIDKEKLKKIVLILFSLSIILDLHIFYNSISTLIRLFFIVLLFIIIVVKYSNKKERIFLISYFAIVFIYFFLHDINCVNVKTLFEGNFNYSTFEELLYFSKMISGVLIIYSIYKLDIKLKDIIKYLKPVIWFITITIIISNIFKIGYSSYTYEIIKGNILDWFRDNNYNFIELSCKGWFHLGNQVVALLLLYFPISLYNLKDDFNVKNIILNFSIVLSLMILGTRLSCYLGLLIPIIIFILFIFVSLINKYKFNYKYLSVMLFISLFSIGLFTICPLEKRYNYYDEIHDSVSFNSNGIVLASLPNYNNDLYDRLLNDKVNKEFFVNSYSYKLDPEFWENILKEPVDKKTNVRYLEVAMTKRVIEINNSKYDQWFGIGYSRIMNIFNIERDYIMQYYSLGIVGAILMLFQYPLIILKIIYKNILSLRKKDTFKNLILLFSLGLVITSCYFSGNILNSISMIIPLSYIIGISINEMRKS